MWIRAIVGIGAYKLALVGLFQQQIVSDSMLRVLEQFPIVGLVIFTLYYVQKQHREDNRQTRDWLEKMLEIQRNSLKEVYNGQNSFMSALLAQIENKQNNMTINIKELKDLVIEELKGLSDQLAINTSTVSEIAKVDSIVSELITKLENK